MCSVDGLPDLRPDAGGLDSSEFSKKLPVPGWQQGNHILRPYRGVVHDLERRHQNMPKCLDGFDSV